LLKGLKQPCFLVVPAIHWRVERYVSTRTMAYLVSSATINVQLGNGGTATVSSWIPQIIVDGTKQSGPVGSQIMVTLTCPPITAGGPVLPVATLVFTSTTSPAVVTSTSSNTALGSTVPTGPPWTEGFSALLQVPYAASTGFGYKVYAIATVTAANNAATIVVTLPPAGDLGFVTNAWGTPAADSPPTTIQFYTGVSSVPTALVPGAPFVVEAAVTAATGQTVGLTSNAAGGLRTVDTASSGLTTSDVFTFIPCPVTGYMQLAAMSSTAPSGYVIITGTAAGFGDSGAPDLTLACGAAALSEGIQAWGVMQVYPGAVASVSASPYTTVALAVRTGVAGATAYLGHAGSTVQLYGSGKGGQAASISLTNPPGFATGVPTGALWLIRLLTGAQCCTLVPAAYYTACWAPNTPYGCPSAAAPTACPLAATLAGGALCNPVTASVNGPGNVPPCLAGRPGSAPPPLQYVQGALAFLQDQCAAWHEGGCQPIAGSIPDQCSGFLDGNLSAACTTACGVGNTQATGACSRLKVQFCATPAAVNAPDCACINVGTSPVPVPSFGGLSYPEYAAKLQTEFGLPSTPQLFPECWWPTCTEGGGILVDTSSGNDTCPTSVLSCVDAISVGNITDSHVKAKIQNECGWGGGASSSSSAPPNSVCSSLAAIVAAATAGPAVAPHTPPPSQWNSTEIAVVASVGAVTLGLLIGACFAGKAWAAGRRR